MKVIIAVLLLLCVGCHTCPPQPPEPERWAGGNRPEDLTDRVFSDEKVPLWLKENYPKWVLYAYDRERVLKSR